MKKIIYIFILLFTITACVSVDDDFHRDPDLIGVWQWNNTCDEYTKECWAPNYSDFVTVEFTHRYFIEIDNGAIVNKLRYTFIDTFISDGTLVYKIRLQDGTRLDVYLQNNYLSIYNDGLLSDYRRLNY